MPHQATSDEYHNICFHGEIRKILHRYNHTPSYLAMKNDYLFFNVNKKGQALSVLVIMLTIILVGRIFVVIIPVQAVFVGGLEGYTVFTLPFCMSIRYMVTLRGIFIKHCLLIFLVDKFYHLVLNLLVLKHELEEM